VHLGVTSSDGPDEAVFEDVLHGWFTSQYPPTEPARLYQTADGGGTWSEQKLPSAGMETDWLSVPRFFDARAGALYGLHVAPPGEAWVWTTADAGRTWSQPVRLPTDGLTIVSFVDRSHWYATAGNRLWRSSNAGTTWTELPQLPTAYWQVPIQFINARHGFALVRAVVPNRCVGGASCMAPHFHSRLLRTDDAGLTWTPITTSP
jgi:photosystem II stability/assembly factor-like uncharacterized protein